MTIHPEMTEEARSSTPQRLMEAAERLFADRDFDDVSVRAINAAAGANAAAVHYHFGSKEALVAAILERRMAPLNAWRRARYDELVKADNRPSRRDLVDLLVHPLLQLMRDDPEGGPIYVQLLTRLYLGREPLVLAQPPTTEPMWTDLVVLACPDLTPERARLRWLLVVDAAMVALNWRFARHDRYPQPELPGEEREDELIDFLVGGLYGSGHREAGRR